jgi:hypothetical protein
LPDVIVWVFLATNSFAAEAFALQWPASRSPSPKMCDHIDRSRVFPSIFLLGRGSTGCILPIYFSEPKKRPEFHVTGRFYSRESKSHFTSPSLKMAMHPPPTIARNIPCHARESSNVSMLEHATSLGDCSNIGRYISYALPAAH